MLTFSQELGGEAVGGAWLSREYGLKLVQPLRYVSSAGPRNLQSESDGQIYRVFRPSYIPRPTLEGHLAFMFKHERIHLELLSRLFRIAGKSEILSWLRREPTGSYARRAAWFYEWLTEFELDSNQTSTAPYIDALEPEKYWVSQKQQNSSKFRVRDNMPGTRKFCPMVAKFPELLAATNTAISADGLRLLESRFGEDLLQKAAQWLTLKESKASFQIEKDVDASREERFAVAMEAHLGRLEQPYTEDLNELQSDILGSKTPLLGLRKSPIFVGQTIRYKNVVHYIAPSFENVPELMHGLSELDKRTTGSNSIIRSAVLSFAFVYIHPLCDANGRISRFIINDVLRRDGITQSPVVLPISATINKNIRAYDKILDRFSAPFRERYAGDWKFGQEIRYADGQHSNLQFSSYEDALHAWRYLDLTEHCLYIGKVLADTISHEMAEEAEFLRVHYLRRKNLSSVIEAGDHSLDRIIRSVSENGFLSGALLSEFPFLSDSELGKLVVRAILEV